MDRQRWMFGRITFPGFAAWIAFVGFAGALTGCSDTLTDNTPQFLYLPFEIDGGPRANGLVDTGGEFEVLLRQPFGLRIERKVQVLAFGGREDVDVTEPFFYTVGSQTYLADGAIVGLSACDCNGLGVRFFKKTGQILALDFQRHAAFFVDTPPADGIGVRLTATPAHLETFEGIFLSVEVESNGTPLTLTGLLDTGAGRTVIRRQWASPASPLTPNRVDITVYHPALGGVAVKAGLFDTPGLPDIIIGTDVMAAWSAEWYMDFANEEPSVWTRPNPTLRVPPPDDPGNNANNEPANNTLARTR